MYKIGCDLEYAVFDGAHYVPAGVLPIEGTKGHPEPMKNGGLEIDCCAVEITPNPATTEDDFVSHILGLFNEVQQRFPYVELHTTPSMKFDISILKTTRMAMTMGCSPDYNAWTGKQNASPKSNGGLRSFGGHVHIETGNRDTIKACDLTAGVFSVIMDKDTERRKLYGKAGAFRPKPYGVEYRTLSNFWCKDEKLIRQVYQLIRLAQKITADVPAILDKIGGAAVVISAINLSDVKRATQIYDFVRVQYGT